MVDVSPFTIGTLLLLKMGLMYIYISKNYILFITEVLKAFSQLRYQFKLLGLANLKTLFVTIIVSIVERERELTYWDHKQSHCLCHGHIINPQFFLPH